MFVLPKGQVYAHPHPSSIPSRRFARVHVVLVGPLPPSLGNTQIFTITDSTTRCAEAIQFPPPQLPPVLRLSANVRRGTTVHNPHHHYCIQSLIQRPCGTPSPMAESSPPSPLPLPSMASAHLPWFLLSFRSSPHKLTSLPPSEAVFGTPLILPAQFPAIPEDDSCQCQPWRLSPIDIKTRPVQ